MGTFADILIRLGETIFSRRDRLQSLRREQADRVAAYLDSIATSLAEMANTLRRGRAPGAECAEISAAARLLPQLEGLNVDDLWTLSLLLGAAEEGPETILSFMSHCPAGLAVEIGDPDDVGGGWVHTLSREVNSELDLLDGVAISPQKLTKLLQDEFQKIEHAAGVFRAVARFLRASPP